MLMNSFTKASEHDLDFLQTQVVSPHLDTVSLDQQEDISRDILTGWACFEMGGSLRKEEFSLPRFDDNSVDLDIICCGVCGTDIHFFDRNWMYSMYPMVAGHEIVGRVTRAGKNVKHLKIGDRAGVGAQCQSCHECKKCLNKKETTCDDKVTYTFSDYLNNGDKTYGGFADKWRGEKEFVFKIPDQLSSVDASSILCAGVTVYSVMKQYNVGVGSKVAILGLGGLGHFAVQFAKAKGAEVVVYDRKPDKKNDAILLGCDDFVLIQNPEEAELHHNTFTHIIATKILNENWNEYFMMLKKDGIFVVLDIPESPLSGIDASALVLKSITIAGTFVAPPAVIEECLLFAAENGISNWAQEFPMSKINEAIQFVRDRKPRYRAVVIN